MRYTSSILPKDARALFRIRHSSRPVVPCHVRVQ